MRLPFVLSTLLLVACGSDPGSPAAAAPSGTTTSTAPAAPPPPPGADPTADAGTSTGSDGGATSDAGTADTRIDPIEVGHSWTYNVQVLGFYPICSNGVFTATALASEMLQGKTAITVQSLCENAGTYKYSVDGDRVNSYIEGGWHLSIDAPVVAGHTWTDGYRDYRWDDIGTMKTPAGTFSDCWSATTVASFTSYIVLCRGVGPVKWHYEDGLGNGYEAILTAKNF